MSYLNEMWEILYNRGLPNEIIKIILIDFKGYENLILNNPFPLMPKYLNISNCNNIKGYEYLLNSAGWRFRDEFSYKLYGRTSNILIRKDDEGIFGGGLVNPQRTNDILLCDEDEDFKNCRVNCIDYDKVKCGLCFCDTDDYIKIELYDLIDHRHTGDEDSLFICRNCEEGIGKIKYCPYNCGRCCVGLETSFKTNNEPLYKDFIEICSKKMGFIDEYDENFLNNYFDENLAGRCFDCLKNDVEEKQDEYLREIKKYNLQISFDGVGDDLDKLKNNLECNEKLFDLSAVEYEKNLFEDINEEERERQSKTIDKLEKNIYELNLKIWVIEKGLKTSCDACCDCENLIFGFNNFEYIEEYFEGLPAHGCELWRLQRNIKEFIEFLEEYFFDEMDGLFCEDCFLSNTTIIYKDEKLYNSLL